MCVHRQGERRLLVAGRWRQAVAHTDPACTGTVASNSVPAPRFARTASLPCNCPTVSCTAARPTPRPDRSVTSGARADETAIGSNPTGGPSESLTLRRNPAPGRRPFPRRAEAGQSPRCGRPASAALGSAAPANGSRRRGRCRRFDPPELQRCFIDSRTERRRWRRSRRSFERRCVGAPSARVAPSRTRRKVLPRGRSGAAERESKWENAGQFASCSARASRTTRASRRCVEPRRRRAAACPTCSCTRMLLP